MQWVPLMSQKLRPLGDIKCTWYNHESHIASRATVNTTTQVFASNSLKMLWWASQYSATNCNIPVDILHNTHNRHPRACPLMRYIGCIVIGIDTKIEVIVASPTTWEAHHSPRAKPEGCGELPRSLVTQQWPKWRYQFLFYHDETKSITNKQKNAR